MISGRYKLVMEGESPNSQGAELYDIEVDPSEVHNLADRRPWKVEEMKSQMAEWQASVLQSLTGADY